MLAHEDTVFARIRLLAETVFARINLLAGWREGTIAMTISGRAYRHTATHYAYSCSVDWQDVVWPRSGEHPTEQDVPNAMTRKKFAKPLF